MTEKFQLKQNEKKRNLKFNFWIIDNCGNHCIIATKNMPAGNDQMPIPFQITLTTFTNFMSLLISFPDFLKQP